MRSKKMTLVLSAVLVLISLSGCGQEEVTETKKALVFYPSPPARPRLQFLKNIGGPEDLKPKKEESSFERFIMGEEAKGTGSIVKPYGIAIHEGKIYLCDTGRLMVEVLDLEKGTFGYLTKDRRLKNPTSVFVDDEGWKYVTDPVAQLIFVYDQNDTLSALLGKDLDISPRDIFVAGTKCYVTDTKNQQVVVIDKTTGKEIQRMGSEGDQEGKFRIIGDLIVDDEGNVYVTDRVTARVTVFDKEGVFKRSVGKWGSNFGDFIRPKGLYLDRDKRLWVIDAATEVAKIFDDQDRLLLFFGMTGTNPGNMNLPADIIIDYDNVKYFEEYAVEGAEIEFLILVTNQFGPSKINVYGFGKFPEIDVDDLPTTVPAKREQGVSPIGDTSDESNIEE